MTERRTSPADVRLLFRRGGVVERKDIPAGRGDDDVVHHGVAVVGLDFLL
jgi:hypothetical protein